MSKVGQKEIEERMRRMEDVCRSAGAKLTHQRTEIFREIAQTDDHPDAEMICRRVRKRIPSVSLDTVYRTLWLLKDMGLIDTLGPARERARFDANLNRHHHFVCIRCGLTRDFLSEQLDQLKLPKSVGVFGNVDTTLVEARGLCVGCADKNTPKSNALKKRRKR